MEQLCLAEGSRPRMTVEEQMERIKRHQQACLREKRKGLNILGVSEQSPSQSFSSVRDNPFKLAQVGPQKLGCGQVETRGVYLGLTGKSDSKVKSSCSHPVAEATFLPFWKIHSSNPHPFDNTLGCLVALGCFGQMQSTMWNCKVCG